MSDQQDVVRAGGGAGFGDRAGDGHPGTEVARTPGKTWLPSQFENPGLPEHVHRMADVDPRAAKRAERQVAALFGFSMVGTLLVVVGFFLVSYTGQANRGADVGTSTKLLGFGMFLALFGIGAGAIHWAKTLMPDVERIEYRHPMRTSEADRADAVGILKTGASEAGLGRRPLLRTTLIGALALVPLPALVFLRDLGPLPRTRLNETLWGAGVRLVKDPEGGYLKPEDLTIGSVAHVQPDGLDKSAHPLDEKAKSAVIVMRLAPEDLDPTSRSHGYQGIVAYSKICTHMGCPVGLYEQQTRHLLCPCHQSTFDVSQHCAVIFGPAKRPLPQLPITVDAQGYLVAKSGFNEPVGPSFWERA